MTETQDPTERAAHWAQVARNAEEKATEAKVARDEAIVEMRKTGMTHRAIGEATNLPHSQIQRILRKAGLS